MSCWGCSWRRCSAISPIAPSSRRRARRKSRLRVVETDPDDDFARSVERDLAALPTIDEHEPRR
jgi:hypothetical protein